LPSHPQNVLVCPLDWGLGHASRMIPVIHQLLDSGFKIIIGGSGKSADLLKLTFPESTFISFPSPRMHYSVNSRWLIIYLLFQLPAFAWATLREHRTIKRIVAQYNIQIVISDNRYGLFCKKAYCIFITHQVSPVLPVFFRWAEYPIYLIISGIIHRYNECWIPDGPDRIDNLSGKLSHRFKIPGNARYIGILSRFGQLTAEPEPAWSEKYELVIVLSGPEPQRHIWFNELMILSKTINRKTLILTGLHEEDHGQNILGQWPVTIKSHLDPQNFYHALVHAGAIICRSGYSSIMDLAALGKTALLVPTPGQTEQEYLAEYLAGKGYFTCVQQRDLAPELVLDYMKNTISMDKNPARNPE
jgi:predicted glycosyltransferase